MWEVACPDASHLRRNTINCGERAFCGERACPALGREAAPNTAPELPDTLQRSYWGCFAAQRGASPLTTASPLITGYCLRLTHLLCVACWLLHPQHNLADMVPTFHPRMGLGGVGVFVDLVDDRQATPGLQYRPDVLAQLFGNRGFFSLAARTQQ